MARKSKTVFFECPPQLVDLVKTVDPSIKVFAAGESLPPVEFQVPLLSLPGLFGTDLSSIPSDVPYLHADPDRLAFWQDRIPVSRGLRIGLAWRGSDRYKRDAVRSPGLGPLRRLLENPVCEFFSLQKDGGGEDILATGLADSVIDVSPDISDFADTAAALSCLDLVISPDTALAHLAGALGLPVWVLLPYAAEWRWLLDRDDSPWYPSARLFRQDRPGDWQGLIDRIAQALAERTGRTG